MSQQKLTPAETLSGHVLEEGWAVGDIIDNGVADTGGFFPLATKSASRAVKKAF